jgi:uncharacterized membrane protein
LYQAKKEKQYNEQAKKNKQYSDRTKKDKQCNEQAKKNKQYNNQAKILVIVLFVLFPLVIALCVLYGSLRFSQFSGC